MREEDAIKKCVSYYCNSKEPYATADIQKLLCRIKSVDADVDHTRRRIHQGYVLEKREKPISGMRAYWRPLKKTDTFQNSNNTSSRKVPVFWRKSESLDTTDSSSRCAVWQCYKQPPQKIITTSDKKAIRPAEEKPKQKIPTKTVDEEATKTSKNDPRRNVKRPNIRYEIRQVQKPRAMKTMQTSSTQTFQEKNISNINEENGDVAVPPDDQTLEVTDIEKIDTKENMKDASPDQKIGLTEEEKVVLKQLEKMRLKEKAKKGRRKKKEYVDRGTRFARTITVSRAEQNCDSPKKCPTCGHKVPERISSASDESSVSEDDSRLDQVAQNAKWALERRAAIHKLFLMDNTDILR